MAVKKEIGLAVVGCVRLEEYGLCLHETILR